MEHLLKSNKSIIFQPVEWKYLGVSTSLNFLIFLIILLHFILFMDRSSVWLKGHAPTNFDKWKTATQDYEVCLH